MTPVDAIAYGADYLVIGRSITGAPDPIAKLAQIRESLEGAAGVKTSIIGTGYVGLVTGACLADIGNDVHVPRRGPRKIDMLNAARSRSTSRA